MSGTALALALAAAAVHAAWNLRLAGAVDTQARTAVAVAAGAVLLAPFALADWELDSAALPYVAASAVLELAYFALLARAYAGDAAELSVTYPVSRGVAPVLVLVAGGFAVSAGQAAGVLLVALGILLVRGPRRPNDGRLVLALAIAACIAGYTVVDDVGVRHAAALTYLALVMALAGSAYVVFLGRARGAAALRAAVTPGTLLAGAGMAAAYALVLLALERAPAAPVAAVRETSVVMATALAAVFLGERVGRARLAGAGVVVAGVAAIALA